MGGVMMFNATFNNISDGGSQFYWWRKPLICHKSLTNFMLKVALNTITRTLNKNSIQLIVKKSVLCNIKRHYFLTIAVFLLIVVSCLVSWKKTNKLPVYNAIHCLVSLLYYIQNITITKQKYYTNNPIKQTWIRKINEF
jgi:membrane-anchored glycerophosphoryl diester phosphodiesterase (GDPDase)